MATITSATTPEQLGDLYQTNCSYDVEGSVAMAKEFVAVCRCMMKRGVTEYGGPGGTRMSFSMAALQSLITAATRWLHANDPARRSGMVKQISFKNFYR